MTSCLNHPFDPQDSELETYNFQLREEINKRLTDNKQSIPHEQVMARMDALLDKQKSETWQVSNSLTSRQINAIRCGPEKEQ